MYGLVLTVSALLSALPNMNRHQTIKITIMPIVYTLYLPMYRLFSELHSKHEQLHQLALSEELSEETNTLSSNNC